MNGLSSTQLVRAVQMAITLERDEGITKAAAIVRAVKIIREEANEETREQSGDGDR